MKLSTKDKKRLSVALGGINIQQQPTKEQPAFANYAEEQAHKNKNQVRRSEMSSREKAKYIADHGSEAYLALPW